jgi:hypothetical protein
MFEIGQRLRVTAQFKDESSAPANPSTVTARMRLPNGTVSSPSVTNPSTGMYRVEHVPTLPGLYKVRVTGSGGIDQSQVIEFVVNHDEVG